MNKSKKNILIAVSVAALLIACIIIFKSTGISDKFSDVNHENIYTIYSEDADNLLEIEVETENGSIRAVNLGNAVWTINDMSTDDIDSSKAYSLAGTVSTLTSKNKVETNPSDLLKYGLDNPDITVTITQKNGEKDKVYIGEKDADTDEYFIMLDGDNTVYTIYSFKVDTIKQPLSFYQDFNRFKVSADYITAIQIASEDETIKIRRSEDNYRRTGNEWEMVLPYQSSANDDYIDTKILKAIENITLNNPVEGKEDYVSDILSSITISVMPYDKLAGKYESVCTETLTVGKNEGDKTYVTYKDKVYAVPSDDISFINDDSFNFVSKMQAFIDISIVKSVSTEYGSERHIVNVESVDDIFRFTLNGRETDDKLSYEMYQSIINLEVDDVYDGCEIKDDTILKLTFECINSDDNTLIEFKPVDDENCALIRNGEVKFTIKTRKITDLISQFTAYTENPMSD